MNLVSIAIVTYNANLSLLKQNIIKYLKFNLNVYIFDNGSSNYFQLMELGQSYSNVTIISKMKNLGIAYALNSLFKLGEENGDKWILTFDQDSKIENTSLHTYLKYIKEFDDCYKIAMLCPQIIDVNVNKVVFGGKGEYEEINSAEDSITSGSCIRVSSWRKVGGFYNKLFIDFVDTDFQEKLLLRNYKIIRLNKVRLFHSIGRAKDIKFLGFTIHCSNHNSFRRYYMVRNRLYFYRKYYGNSMYYKALIKLSLGTIKIILFEDEKKGKVKAFFKGWKDYKKIL